MSWLPVEKLTTEEKEIIQDFNKRKATLLGKYNQQIKDLDTTHETWVGNFSSQHKRRLQKCQELYASEPSKIHKTVYSTYELHTYAIYKTSFRYIQKYKKNN